MPAELACQRLDEDGLAVLRVVGSLTLATAPHLRTSALKCLADQPDAVVVDATRLSVPDDIHLTVLIAAARHAAAWPGVPLIVCAPPPPLASALARLGVDRYIEIVRDFSEARAHVKARELAPHIRAKFAATAGAVAGARRLVVDACTGWRLDHLTSSARLVMSELVTNAVVHAGTPMDVDVHRRGRYLHIAVRDFDPHPARLVGPKSETAPGGRGLLLVDTIATAWGCTPTVDGKVTWASFTSRISRFG